MAEAGCRCCKVTAFVFTLASQKACWVWLLVVQSATLVRDQRTQEEDASVAQQGMFQFAPSKRPRWWTL